MDHNSPGFSVHGIFQAWILEWVATPSSRGSSWPRDQTWVSYVPCAGRRVLHHQCHLRRPICCIPLDNYHRFYMIVVFVFSSFWQCGCYAGEIVHRTCCSLILKVILHCTFQYNTSAVYKIILMLHILEGIKQLATLQSALTITAGNNVFVILSVNKARDIFLLVFQVLCISTWPGITVGAL